MKLSLLFVTTLGIILNVNAQKVITLKPNGEVRVYSNADLKHHEDIIVDGNRISLSDSGEVYNELYLKDGHMNGYYKAYKNGILVKLELYKDDVPIGTHYFWDETGILKKSTTYKDGKEVAVKQY